MRCPSGGFQNPPGLKFCGHCTTLLPGPCRRGRVPVQDWPLPGARVHLQARPDPRGGIPESAPGAAAGAGGSRGRCGILPHVLVLEEPAHVLDGVLDPVARERASGEWMFGKDIVYREGMNDGREDVCLCRR
jgi:hypothetical protein